MKRSIAILLAVIVFASFILAGCGNKADKTNNTSNPGNTISTNSTDDNRDVNTYYKYLSSSEYDLCVEAVKAIDDYMDNKITFAESDKIINHAKTVIDGIDESFLDADGKVRSDLTGNDDIKKAAWIMTFRVSLLGAWTHYVIEEDDENPYIESKYLIEPRNSMAKLLGMTER